MKSGIVGHLGGIIIKKLERGFLQYLILDAAKNEKVLGPKSAPKGHRIGLAHVQLQDKFVALTLAKGGNYLCALTLCPVSLLGY